MDVSQQQGTVTSVKNIARAIIYPALTILAVWAFLIPAHTQALNGFYPAAPSPVTIDGPYPHGDIYVPAVSDQSKPRGTAYLRAHLFTGTWRPGIDPAPHPEASDVPHAWMAAKLAAYRYANTATPLVEHHPDNSVGSSFGLAATLAAIDTLTPGTLIPTPVAATGSVTQDGTVHKIGGVHAKLVGVQDAGLTVLLIPADNLPELPADTGGVTVVPVHTVDDALAWLCTQPSSDDYACVNR